MAMKFITKLLTLYIAVIQILAANRCPAQTLNKEFINDRQGNKIHFEEIENVVHIGFMSGATQYERESLLEDLSKLGSFDMFSDSTYRFVVAPSNISSFHTKACANNCIEFCQNEYRDSLGGVVWGTNRIMVKMKPNCSIVSLSLHAGIGGGEF